MKWFGNYLAKDQIYDCMHIRLYDRIGMYHLYRVLGGLHQVMDSGLSNTIPRPVQTCVSPEPTYGP